MQCAAISAPHARRAPRRRATIGFVPIESVEAASRRPSSSGCSPAKAPNPRAPVDSTAARRRSTTASAVARETPAASYVLRSRSLGPRGDGGAGHAHARGRNSRSASSPFVAEEKPPTKGETMKFLLFVCWDAERMDAQVEPDPSDAAEPEGFPWLDDLQARGAWITGDQLAPPRRARSVRVRDGEMRVTDGPFAETKETVGGFDLIEAGSLAEAVEIAAGHPVAQMGTIEVRPLWGN